jgi:hypothetical protein
MKTRRMLYFAILAGLLVTMSAIPALAAEGDIPMYVHQSRVAHTGRSSGGTDDIVGYIHIRDDNLERVAGAEVTADWQWTLFDGTEGELAGQTATTGDQGLAVFDDLYEGYGEYTICVTTVTKTGWEYVPDSNWEGQTCATLVVAPQYQPGK